MPAFAGMFCAADNRQTGGMASSSTTALCSAIPLPIDGSVPEWLHLLPVGEVRTRDGRGPYRVADAAHLMAVSTAAGKLAIDENHSTDLAAPKGGSAPARGWIVSMEARDDGIWGKVEWTPQGRRIAKHQEYRGISPVIAHRKDGTITAILRASLTNTPNLTGLTALHSEKENGMDLRVLLIEALGLDSAASDEDIVAAVKKKADGEALPAALQSALAPIARIVGLGNDADAQTVLAGVQRLKEGGVNSDAVTALQSELTSVTNQLNALTENGQRKDATNFVDAAIAECRVGVKPMRDRYIAMHMKDAAGTEELINAMPILKGGSSISLQNVEAKPGDLGEADNQVIALMGIDREAYQATFTERQEAL